MTVLVSQKNTFNVTQLVNVSSITFANDTYSITAGGTTTTYSKASYIIFIIN